LEGTPAKPGTYDPVEEAITIQKEVDEWFKSVVKKVWENKISRQIYIVQNPIDYITQNLSGLSVRKQHVVKAIENAGLADKSPRKWDMSDVEKFAVELRRVSKPIIIAANKADLPYAEEKILRLKKVFGEDRVIPISALAEYILRKASQNNYIEYIPGDPDFRVIDEKKLSQQQKRVLEMIREKVLRKYGGTGVQRLLNHVVFNVLDLIVVYPVEDQNKFTDHYGNILPDAYLVPKGTTVKELAYMIHTELGRTFLYAINAKTKERIGEDYVLRDNDVIKIVATAARK
ncbi:MAG: TGS domain-containing protein, partial [Staphylothermus sp.]|nr:TGS domain-containing protein [Staphylothermus sp.]